MATDQIDWVIIRGLSDLTQRRLPVSFVVWTCYELINIAWLGWLPMHYVALWLLVRSLSILFHTDLAARPVYAVCTPFVAGLVLGSMTALSPRLSWPVIVTLVLAHAYLVNSYVRGGGSPLPRGLQFYKGLACCLGTGCALLEIEMRYSASALSLKFAVCFGLCVVVLYSYVAQHCLPPWSHLELHVQLTAAAHSGDSKDSWVMVDELYVPRCYLAASAATADQKLASEPAPVPASSSSLTSSSSSGREVITRQTQDLQYLRSFNSFRPLDWLFGVSARASNLVYAFYATPPNAGFERAYHTPFGIYDCAPQPCEHIMFMRESREFNADTAMNAFKIITD